MKITIKIYLLFLWGLNCTIAIHSVSAAEFSRGDLLIQLDNTIGYGIGIRTSERDPGTIISGNGLALDLETNGSSYNYDDGNLNYGTGDIYTHNIKLVSDLEINYRNYGGFFRTRAFYDAAIMNNDTLFKPINESGEDDAGRAIELLDAYIFADYYIAAKPLTARLGRQVISWGESTFIQGGINSINPVDASAFRKPGAEIKEALLPVNLLYASVGLTDDFTIEGFYQLEWQKTKIDPCGTFFSTNDFVADGCGPVVLGGDEVEQVYLSVRDQQNANNIPLRDRVINPITERVADDEPSDTGQYGMALRLYTDINDGTEFGFYYLNIHSRVPYISGVVTNYAPTDIPEYDIAAGDRVNPNPDIDSFRPLYQISYPENLNILGISFSTSMASGATLAGEISYKPDTPLQWNAFELLLGGAATPQSRLYQKKFNEIVAAGKHPRELFGNLADGYDEFDVWQTQSTWIKFIDQTLGADRLVIIAEAGFTYIPDLPEINGINSARYGRSGAYGIGNNDGVISENSPDFCSLESLPAEEGETPEENLTRNQNTDYCTDEGYVTQFAGGIRLLSLLDYNNFYKGITLTPRFSLGYDRGNGPEPASQFIDKRLTSSIGVGMTYMNNTSINLTYTNFSGGDYSVMKDRDNLTFSASYSF